MRNFRIAVLSFLVVALAPSVSCAFGSFFGPPVGSPVASTPLTVYIGTTTGTLDGNSVLTSSGSVIIQSTTTNATQAILTIRANNGDLLMSVRQDGKVGIGTNNPLAKLDVAGNAQFGDGPTKSTIAANGRWSQYQETNCATATPSQIGEDCAMDDTTDPKWISTSTNAGGFTPYVLVSNIPFGHVHQSTGGVVETVLSSNFVFVKAAGTCSEHASNNFTESAECTLRYDGVVEKTFVIEVVFSVSKSMGSATIGYFRVAKNGDPDTTLAFGMQSLRSLANTSDIGNVSVRAVFTAVQNDTFDLWVATADADNLTIETRSMTVQVE